MSSQTLETIPSTSYDCVNLNYVPLSGINSFWCQLTRGLNRINVRGNDAHTRYRTGV